MTYSIDFDNFRIAPYPYYKLGRGASVMVFCTLKKNPCKLAKAEISISLNGVVSFNINTWKMLKYIFILLQYFYAKFQVYLIK